MNELTLTRRLLVAAAGAPLISGFRQRSSVNARIRSTIATYAAAGAKRSGLAGELGFGAHIESHLAQAGYRTSRQAVDCLAYPSIEATISCGGASERKALLLPPATAHGPVRGRLSQGPADGAALLVIRLGVRRWSSASQPEVMAALAGAFQQRPGAVLLVTEGPTGLPIALNVANRPAWPSPVFIMGGADVSWLEENSGADCLIAPPAPAVMAGTYNLIGSFGDPDDPQLVLSTPRTGWFGCVAERGSGIACWLELALWAARQGISSTVVCTAAHEFENAGMYKFMQAAAPPPRRSTLWVHIGSGLAARDWHEAGSRLLPLPNVDSQRFLMGTDADLDALRASFSGQPGLESPYPVSAGAAGELGEIAAAGYRVCGAFGAHRFHHTALDDEGCAHQAATVAATAGWKAAIRGLLP